MAIEDLDNLDPVVRVQKYLAARDGAGIIHRNVDTVDDSHVTTEDLEALIAEVKELRKEVMDVYLQLDRVAPWEGDIA